MKKLLVVALAAIGMVACVQNEVVETPKSSAIAFESAFINNATRAAADPSITTATIDGFNVWGFMDQPEAYVFVAEDVTKTADGWDYANTQYWAPAHTYYFAALAPMDSANWTLSTDNANTLGAGIVSFLNVDGSEDLIYAATSVETPKTLEELTNNGMEKVGLTFNHLLSKVKFTFKNGFLTDNVSIVVRDVEMKAKQGGSLDLATADWWVEDKWTDNGATTLLDFGDVEKLTNGKSAEAAQERLTIPADAAYVYAITFNVDYYVGGVLANTFAKESNVSGVALRMGNAYNFTAEINPANLNLPAIEFDVVAVKDWVDPYVDVDANQLQDLINNGGEVTLEKDWTLGQTLIIPAGKDVVLNLNGKSIKTNINTNPTDVIVVEEGATLTINGEGTVEAATGNDGYAVIADGTLIINGGTYKAGVDANGETNAIIYARGNGKVYVKGGNFPNDNESGFVLNKKDADRATTVIEVSGGTFTKFNPGNNAAEGAGTNFLAPYYEAVQNGDVYTVQLDSEYVVNNAEELKTALADGDAKIFLAPGVTFEGIFYTSAAVEIVSLDTNKATISGSLNSHSGALTVKNVAFKASNNSLADPQRGTNASYSGNGYCKGTYAAIVSLYAQDATFEGCEFTGLWDDAKACAINTYTCANNNLLVKDCYFEGKTKAMYVRCNTTIEGCTFNMPDAVGAYVLGNGTNNDGYLTVINNNIDGLYAPVGFLNNYPYNDIHVNIQGNTGVTTYGVAWVNSFANSRPNYTFTFETGSKTF